MSYRIDPGAPLGDEVRRIAAEQIDKAIAELSDAGRDRHEAVHDVRKRLKKLRGLLILLKGSAPSFARAENARYRDIARALSAVRDRTALIEALDALQRHFAGEPATRAFEAVRQTLTARRDAAIGAEGDLGATVLATIRHLGQGRAALDDVHLKGDKTVAPASDGFAKTCGAVRRALTQARRTGEAEDFHALRKALKYHAMHLQLLAPLWPEVLKATHAAAAEAAEQLGSDHDYAVLRAELTAEPHAFGDAAHLSVILALADRRQAELRAAALATADRLLAEAPSAAGARIATLYRRARKAARHAAEDPGASHLHAA